MTEDQVEQLAKRAYKMWVKRMDSHWHTNYPRWKHLNAHSRRSWLTAAEVFRAISDD
jgi:hypothetical protein